MIRSNDVPTAERNATLLLVMAVGPVKQILLTLDRADPHDREVLDSWTTEFSYGFTTTDREAYTQAFAQGTEQP